MPRSSAAALATASDTASVALAPSRALFGVPSSDTSASSMRTCSVGSLPPSVSSISPWMLAIAWRTPLPP